MKYVSMCLLNKWKGYTGKYLAGVHDVQMILFVVVKDDCFDFLKDDCFS